MLSRSVKSRYPGRVSARGHDTTKADAAPAATAEGLQAHADALAPNLQFVDARGQALPVPVQGRYQLLPITGTEPRPHAVTAEATLLAQQLSTFAVGYPSEPVDALIDFLAPTVPAGIYFDFVTWATANRMPVVDGDAVGADGFPPVIVMDPNTHTSARLISRGVRVPFSSYDKRIAASTGLGVDTERQARTAFGLNAIRRGRAARVIALMETTHGGAHAVTIGATADPIKTVRPYITAIADVVGSLDYVRVVIGGSSWNSFADHAVLVGGSGGTGRQDVTPQRLARGWSVRESNLLITNHRVVTSVQGVTTTTSTIMGGTQFWIYGCKDRPDREDPSFLKTFAMPMGAGFYGVSVQDLGGDNEMIWIEYFERVLATNSTAADRLALTFS